MIIETLKNDAVVVVKVGLSDGPVAHVSYVRGKSMQVDRVVIEYRLCAVSGYWAATRVDAHGNGILNPGPNGETRVGTRRHGAKWYTTTDGDIQACTRVSGGSGPLPVELSDLINKVRPSVRVASPDNGGW